MAPPVVQDVLGSPGQPLEPRARALMESRFGHDFGNVRVHTDWKAAESARAVNALAYTMGRDVVFGAGQYTLETTAGKRLLAHELAHVVQQSSLSRSDWVTPTLRVQRDIPETALATTSAADIMRDDNYIDNNMKEIEYYSAELAIIHYADGSTLRLGLVPEYVEAPVEGVDYRTLAREHIGLVSSSPGTFQYIPRGHSIETPPGMTYGEFLRETTRTVTFRRDPASGRIVPTQVNSLTAPRLCSILRDAEARYVREFDAMAAGAVEVLEALEVIVILSSLVGIGTIGARGAAGPGAAAGASMLARAESALLRAFLRLLRTGGAETVTVEGVEFVTVRVLRKGAELVVRRFGIRRLVDVAGRGRLIHAAYERAAIAAAREAGATSARVLMETPVNAAWRAYLESQGYAMQIYEKVGEFGFESLLTKVFPL